MNSTDAAVLELIAVDQLAGHLPALEGHGGPGVRPAAAGAQSQWGERMSRLAAMGLIASGTTNGAGRPTLTAAGLEALRYLCTG